MNDIFTENIIRDLYALDPSLEERDAEVRSIVNALMSVKPTVSIDPTFVSNLRAQLVKPVNVVRESIPSPFESWLLRLTPLAGVAILILMLVPEIITPTRTYQNESVSSEEAMFTLPAPTAKRTAPAEPESSSLMLVAEDAALATDSFTVSEQQRGDSVLVDFVFLTAPSFVVIQRNDSGEPGEIIGVSPLLHEGHMELIDVPLISQTEAEETYFAVLYRDDGDSLWREGYDVPVFDASGITPLSVLFSTLPASSEL